MLSMRKATKFLRRISDSSKLEMLSTCLAFLKKKISNAHNFPPRTTLPLPPNTDNNAGVLEFGKPRSTRSDRGNSCRPTCETLCHPPGPRRTLKRSLTRTLKSKRRLAGTLLFEKAQRRFRDSMMIYAICSLRARACNNDSLQSLGHVAKSTCNRTSVNFDSYAKKKN